MEGWCIARMREELFHHTMPARVWRIAVRDGTSRNIYIISGTRCMQGLTQSPHYKPMSVQKHVLYSILFAQILFMVMSIGYYQT